MRNRALLIIAAPILFLELAAAVVFLDRHRNAVAEYRSRDAARDISLLLNVIAEHPQSAPNTAEILDLSILQQIPPNLLPPENNARNFHDRLSQTLPYPFTLQQRNNPHQFIVHVKAPQNPLTVAVNAVHVVPVKTQLFFFWTFLGAALAVVAAVLLILNQVKPVLRLAKAMERFDADETPAPFTISGAAEVRRAGHAFLTMRRRILNHIRERSLMLAGISHDLRSPLTRLKLHLELAPQSDETSFMHRDILELERLVDEYLEFMRERSSQKIAPRLTPVPLLHILQQAAQDADQPDRISLDLPSNLPDVLVRKNTFRRALLNILNNACKHAQNVRLSAQLDPNLITLLIDDDGPGIPKHLRPHALLPFERLDDARNPNANSPGLGLAIAEAVVSAHRGSLSLLDSPLGGLRVQITLPLNQRRPKQA